MQKRITVERMARELLAAKNEYNAARSHFAQQGKLTNWERECKRREQDRYRRVILKGIRFLSEELEFTLDDEKQPPKIPSATSTTSAIEQDIAEGKTFDL